MMKRLNILYIIFAFASLITAAQTSFTVIPPRNVIAGERFQVIYRLSNAQGTSLKVPEINGCKLLYGPSTSTSQSYQVINGVSSSSYSTDYTYIYRAETEGTFTIPEASIVADGKTLTTEAKKFSVLPADNPGNGGNGSNISITDPDSQSADHKISKDDIFVRIILNKTTAYEQEAIECTLKLYTKFEAITSFVPTSPANYDGFLIDEVPLQAQLNNVENFNGQNYRTAILKKCIIFPQKTGTLTINSGTYDVTVQQLERISQGYFYFTRPIEKQVKLQPFTAKVNVKPLPQPQPEGFNGAVGKFEIKGELSSNSLRTNEAASLVYTVTGTGNIKYLKEPAVELPVEFEQYTPKQDYDTHVSGSTVSGKMTAEYTFVPQSVGKFTIPETNFVYFNPATGEYRTMTAKGFQVDVAKGAASQNSSAEQQEIKIKNTDILHIKLGDKNPSKDHLLFARQTWYWMLYPILLIALITIIAVSRRNNRLNADVTGRKIAHASKVARKRLSAASRFLKSGEKEQFYDAVLKAIWGYLSDKLNIPASSLTRSNVSEELISFGASEKLTTDIIAILDDCEIARYTPDSSTRTLQEIYDAATKAMNEMETIKK